MKNITIIITIVRMTYVTLTPHPLLSKPVWNKVGQV